MVPSGGRALARRLDFSQVFPCNACKIILEVFIRKGNVHRADDILCMQLVIVDRSAGDPRATVVLAIALPFPVGESQHRVNAPNDEGELR